MGRTAHLSEVEQRILDWLIAKREMYGMQLVDEAGNIKKGSVYVTLGRMATKGLVRSRTVKSVHEPGPARRLFRPTALGYRTWEIYNLMDAHWRSLKAERENGKAGGRPPMKKKEKR